MKLLKKKMRKILENGKISHPLVLVDIEKAILPIATYIFDATPINICISFFAQIKNYERHQIGKTTL